VPRPRGQVNPPLDTSTLRPLTRQDARCPLCGDHLLTAEQAPRSLEKWERRWLQVTRRAIAANSLLHHGGPGSPDGDQNGDQTRLVHASCHRGHLTRQDRAQHSEPEPPSRLA